MGKGVKYILVILLGVLIAGLLLFNTSVDSIIKSGIEQNGSEMTGTAVTVESVSISPFSGKGTINGFRVANPSGYDKEYAIEVEELTVELSVMSLFSDLLEVHTITMKSPSIYVEQKLPENNIREILQTIKSKDSFETSDSEMIVGRFLMEDGHVDLYTEVGGERSARVEVSRIELNDLGTGDERRAVEQIVQQIAEEIGEEALRAAVRSGGEQLRDAIRDLFD